MLYWSFWGMNALWWLFWILLAITFFMLLTPVPRSRARLYEDPLAILQRRFARGEIDANEYEARKAVLRRDSGGGPPASPPKAAAPHPTAAP